VLGLNYSFTRIARTIARDSIQYCNSILFSSRLSARVSPGNSSKRNVVGPERRNNGRQQWMMEDSMRHGNAVTTQTTLVSTIFLSLFLSFTLSLWLSPITWFIYDAYSADRRLDVHNFATFSSVLVVTTSIYDADRVKSKHSSTASRPTWPISINDRGFSREMRFRDGMNDERHLGELPTGGSWFTMGFSAFLWSKLKLLR